MGNPGTDISCNTTGDSWDLDPTFTVIAGPQVLLEHCARAIQTRRGLMSDEPSRGFDVEDLENARSGNDSIRTIQAAIRNELLQDERIDSVEVTIRVQANDVWHIMISGNASDATNFRFVFQIKDGGGVAIITGAANG